MGCLDAVLDEGRMGFYEGRGRRRRGFLGKITLDFAIGSFVYNGVLLLLCFLRSRVGHDGPPGKNRTEPQGEFYHEEGAPTLLFLMVASEHSASDESQSESPNWSGFS